MDEGLAAQWRGTAGYVPQTPYISDVTLRENIAFGESPDAIDDLQVMRCIELAGLTDFVAVQSQGLHAKLGDRGVRVSGGQRQRIAIARALYRTPTLLVLDEATSALDPLTEAVIQDAIVKLRLLTTTITVAHRLATVKNCDWIFLLDGGRLVDQGSWTNLLERSALFQKLVNASLLDPRSA
jgi:HlyD family secretion protein